MVHNEKGVTLIELLAALVIFGLFSTIIWAFFFQTIQANETEMTKNSLQQEANLIMNTFQEVHRKSESYVVTISENRESLEISTEIDGSFLFNKTGVLYEITADSFVSGDQISPAKDNFPLVLTLTAKENNNLYITIETVFSKIK
jgi:prepilin-type N-terminal cleavage/methylation domain-containing protein